MEFLLGLGTALWLGILTSISPCPLATNIAAMSYIGRRVDRPTSVLWTGIFYTLGRALTYFLLGWLIVASLLNTPQLSFFLQKYMHKVLGPLLILVGMFMVELLSFQFKDTGLSQWVSQRAETWGFWGAGALGIVFALSFCPVSAALFFGSLIPLAIRHQSGALFPSLYGVGTALPVVFFAILLALGTHSLSKMFNRITQVEWWARRITGALFILIGMYLTLNELI
ncbi:sulfite exporter TauE/SafE family protein [bacterium]|nr:sulfite exporter TauE/SafE family protein [bacterium]